MEKKTEARVGLGFAEALTLLFIALKLCGVITWSWLWVLSPIWISLALVAMLGLIIVVITAIQKRKYW
jgi:Flp pilus assembly protein TadB